MKPAHPRNLPNPAGFTLVEVLVTLAIMGLVMLGLQVTLQATIYTHDDLAVDMAKVREGPRLLDMVERDVRALHCYNIKDNEVFRGESVNIGGVRADRIDLITTRDSGRRFEDPHANWQEPRMVASDVTEVGYRLRMRPDGLSIGTEPLMELYRREDVFVDEEPLEGGRYERLHDRVLFLEVIYLTELGDDADEEDDWDLEKKKRLPAAIQITLGLQPHSKVDSAFTEIQEAQRQRTVHRRIITLPDSMNRALAVRPAQLVWIDENKIAGNAGGGGGGAGGGAEGSAGGMMSPGGEGGNFPGMGGRDGNRPGGERGGSSVMDSMRGNRGDGSDRIGFDFNKGIRNGSFGIGGDFNMNDSESDLLDGWLSEYEGRYSDGS